MCRICQVLFTFLSLLCLNTFEFSGQSAGSLTSPARNGWESGQLISDALPCMTTGLRVTATAWRSKVGPGGEQPKLQVTLSFPHKHVNISCSDLCQEFERRKVPAN